MQTSKLSMSMVLIISLSSACGVKETSESESTLSSICGTSEKFVAINSYQGPMKWVQAREGAVGRLNGSCSGTYIGGKNNLFLTAGHCVARGSSAVVEFNYEAAADGNVARVRGTTIESSRSPDYALIRLDSNPGVTPTPLSTNVTNQLAIIQHPAARRKVIATGPRFGAAASQLLSYSIDTLGGSSGSGILNSNGELIGVHTLGGCYSNGGANRGWNLTSILNISGTLAAAVGAGGQASPPAGNSCLGADGVTNYPHKTVTTYLGNTYTCNNGKWDFSPGI